MTRDEKIALAKDLRIKGFGYGKIGKILGHDHSAIRYWLCPLRRAKAIANAKKSNKHRDRQREKLLDIARKTAKDTGEKLSSVRRRLGIFKTKRDGFLRGSAGKDYVAALAVAQAKATREPLDKICDRWGI